jgi:pimeloyl-ACP methyl ester carboxylesterase
MEQTGTGNRVLTPFGRRLQDPSSGYAADLDVPSDTLMIVFAGIRGELGIPSYDFLSISATQGVKRLFLRDHHRSWYHLGVLGLAGSVDELVAELRRMIEGCGAERVVLVGNSAGGYAALLYAGLLGADAALAFSPRTFFSWPARLRRRDFRYRRDAVRLTLRGHPRKRYRDLRDTPAAGRSEIHHSTGDRLDTLHAQRMRGIPGYAVHPHAGGSHHLVREMRDRGELGAVLSDVLVTRTR